MGETVEYSGKIKLNVFVPSPKSEIKLIHNGELIETYEGSGMQNLIAKEPGIYQGGNIP